MITLTSSRNITIPKESIRETERNLSSNLVDEILLTANLEEVEVIITNRGIPIGFGGLIHLTY